jgi:protein ImuB
MSAPSRNATWLAVFLPRFSTDRLIRAGRAPEGKPLVVYAKTANAYVLTGVNAHAARLGLRPEMPLADARAIYPSLLTFEATPEEDARTLDRIAAWCERFAPVVVLDPPHGLFLDVSGCGHLFGGEDELRDLIVTRLKAQGFAARAALAETPGAAWALARYARWSILAQRVENKGEEELARLPIEALRLDDDAAALLRRLGLKTIGQVATAPRSPFTARAGERAMLRLDQALGRAPEALSPRRPPPPVFAARRFLEPLFSVETILVAAQRLCEDVAAKLDLRGAGARACVLHLFGVDGRDRAIRIGVSRPERDAKALLRLFREKLSIAAETLDAEFGIEMARLDVAQLERISGAPRALVAEDPSHASAERIGAIVDVLSARLGAKRVLQAKLNDAHAPERAGGWRVSPEEGGGGGGGVFKRVGVGPYVRPSPPGPLSAREEGLRRPLTLFSRAQPVDVLATVPDGPPIRFRWRRVLREVARAEGPERICGDWLRDEPARDYYRIEDRQGRRYWLYREGMYGEDAAPRWFMHGLFA